MMRNDRENLIEQYLNGKLTIAQEQDFFIEIATNRELRSELKAYQITEGALRKDAAHEAYNYTTLRAQLEATMHAIPVPKFTSIERGTSGTLTSINLLNVLVISIGVTIVALFGVLVGIEWSTTPRKYPLPTRIIQRGSEASTQQHFLSSDSANQGSTEVNSAPTRTVRTPPRSPLPKQKIEPIEVNKKQSQPITQDTTTIKPENSIQHQNPNILLEAVPPQKMP